MKSTSEIAKSIGQTNMAAALGVGVTAVNNAVKRGFFPSSWFLTVTKMAKNQGIECDPAIFRMKPAPSETQDVQ